MPEFRVDLHCKFEGWSDGKLDGIVRVAVSEAERVVDVVSEKTTS